MKLSNIRSWTVALLLGLVTAITAVNQARSPDDGKGG